MSGIIGKKIGMTSVFSADGRNIPCTVLQCGPCVVTQVKTVEKDKYKAVQLAFDDKKSKNTSKPLTGHFKNANTTPKKLLVEFKNFESDLKLGDILTVDKLFEEGLLVAVIGTSKGKGFQGVVKRHNFSGVGGSSHGQHDRQRAPGSLGASSYPSRVMKGLRMAGRMGNDRVKVSNIKILKIIPEQNVLIVKGSVPGANGSYLIVEN